MEGPREIEIKKLLKRAVETELKSRGLADAGPVAAVAEIKYTDGPLTIPNGMPIQEAINLLERRKEYLEEEVDIRETFDVFPWDGAHAIDIVLTRKFGWSAATATPGMFGPNPPKLISIEVGPGTYKQVPWGAFSLPGVAGLLHCSAGHKNGRITFSLVAHVQRKDEATIREIFELTRQELRVNSIYRGQAIKVRFTDDNGDDLEMPEPRFMDTSDTHEEMVIYSKDVQQSVRTNLFTPITRVADCIANEIPVKRGVILGGPYGTGKTLAAMVAAKLAVDNGITFVYVGHADELAKAIEFAKQYQSPACVVFCEDIDRAMDGERTVEMDDILNIIDGIDTKSAHIITVLTTNHLENINPAMLRPGRLDAVIEVTPPDADAVVGLVRLYGGGAIDPSADLNAVGKVLQGQIPAVIAEVVKRAKLHQLGLQKPGTRVEKLSAEALVASAKSMTSQIELLRKQSEPKEKPATLEQAFIDVVGKSLNGTKERVKDLHDRIM